MRKADQTKLVQEAQKLTKDWPKIRLGSVLTRSAETTELRPDVEYREITVRLWGKGVLERGRVIGAEIAGGRRFTARPGQFIASRIDARNGAMGIVPDSLDGAAVTNDFPLFNLNVDRLLPSYIGWLCRTNSFVELCKRASEGTTNRVRLQESRFLALEISLPPLAEQRRIVARIEELATQIKATCDLRDRAINETVALVAQVIKSKFEEGQAQGWNQRTLADFMISDCYGTSEKTNDDDTGIPVLRMGNIQDGHLRLRDLKYLHIAEMDRPKMLLQKGDIVVNRTNSAELVGKCAVFDIDGDFGFASYLIRIRLNLDIAEPKLIASYINSPIGRSYMMAERKQMTGQANVNAKKLKALPIELPSLSEQRRIVAELDDLQSEVDKLKCLQAETATELDALLPAILDRAFKGELL